LAAYSDEIYAKQEYRQKATQQLLRLQCGGCSAARAYIIFQEESVKSSEHAEIFSEVIRVADMIEKDFLETFGRQTRLGDYPRVANNGIKTDRENSAAF
jgi:hypothetical protein